MLIEQELDLTEHSASARILSRIVALTKPEVYPAYRLCWDLVRGTDNLVDEGSSYNLARELITTQQISIGQTLNDDSAPSEESNLKLNELINRIPCDQKINFAKRYLDVLEYFQTDLDHRWALKPYSKKELNRHIQGGFTSFFGALKIILSGEDLSGNQYFLKLAYIHGQSEPLGDLTEDLERGLILHSKKDGADWVDILNVKEPVPQIAIDQYVISRRRPIAKDLFKNAPAAYQEFGGIIGLLMTLDYYNRSKVTALRRFSPKQPVIFAQYQMGL